MTVAWSDLGGALLAGLVWITIIAAVLAILVWNARRRRVPSVILDVTGTAARVWVGIVFIGAVVGLIALIASPVTTLTELPVAVDWPSALPCQSAGEAAGASTSLYCARLPTATAEIAALSGGIKTLVFAGGLLAYVAAAMPGVLVSVLCSLASAGTPFARPASRWLLVSSVVILVSGMLGEIVLAIARFLAAGAVLPGAQSGDPATAPSTFAMTVPVWPIGAALALAALAVIFRHGSQLQRDNEGLI
jgi:hypothetical protein